MPQEPLMNAYLALSRKLPDHLKYSSEWHIKNFYLHSDYVEVEVTTPSGEVINLRDTQDEFPSDTLAASILMLL